MAADPLNYCTVIVPVIDGWIAQWYPKLPALVNVWLKELPGARFPLLKAPVSLVTVCVVESLLVQVTVAPVGTVSVAGANEKLDIVTALADGGGVVVDGVVGVE